MSSTLEPHQWLAHVFLRLTKLIVIHYHIIQKYVKTREHISFIACLFERRLWNCKRIKQRCVHDKIHRTYVLHFSWNVFKRPLLHDDTLTY